MYRILLILVMFGLCRAQIVEQPSIMSFVRQVGNTTAEQNEYVDAWGCWWGNSELLIQSVINLLNREMRRNRAFSSSGYSRIGGVVNETTVSARHQYTIKLLLKQCRVQDVPKIFTETHAVIRSALENVDSLMIAEKSYLLTGSVVDKSMMTFRLRRVALRLSETRDLFWSAVIATKQ